MKNAIVTGATKGIGFGIAKMLLKEGFFVTVTYAHDVDSADNARIEFSKISSSFEIIKVDQSCRKEMKFFAEEMRKKDTIDCIVCNAGATLRKNFKDIEDEEWLNVMEVNVNSSVFLIRDLFDIIPNNSRIIFIGSMMAVEPHGTSLAYGVTKSAVHALAKNMVKCFEGTGTTVNAIAPGFVETEWQKNKPDEIRQNIYRKTAIKRFADIEEIADAVHFCVNNAFVNGAIIEVSGGYNFK